MPLARWLCLLLLACTPLLHASPRIGVMTMAPGEIFFERFGHDAIVVYDEASQSAISYNFGFFDMGEPGFAGNFVRGVMNYSLVALPLEQDLAYYRDVGRGVRIQWLDLRPQQASALADALAENAKPENARYRYDYFTDNCASRVRDALDTALGGALKQQLAPQSHGRTYRSEAVRLASPAPWMWLGFDIGLGPYADRPLSAWDEAFIPMRLAEHLRGARNSDGRPLVLDEVEILPERVAPEPVESARMWWPWLLGGVLLAIGIGLLGMRQPRIVGGLAGLLWLPAGIAGAVLLYLWGFSEHRAAWANHNVLLFNPMCLLLLPAAMALLRGRDIARWQAWLATIVALCAVLALVLACLPFAWQDNRAWVALLLPIHAALAWVLHKRRGLPRIRR